MRGIKYKNHKLHTYESNKTSLPAFDDKCFILSDGISTSPYGHKDILNMNKKIIFFFNILDYLKHD